MDSRSAHQKALRINLDVESMVPAEIAEVIKRRQFFGYREPEAAELSPVR